MATIGVTRGLGDHDLKVYNSNIHIKPFLSCCPEVSAGAQTQEELFSNFIYDSEGQLWEARGSGPIADIHQ